MALFRLLHVSDLHIGAHPQQLGFLNLPFIKAGFKVSGYTGTASVSSHNEDMLEGLALLAWMEGHALDGILITGDLATTGSSGDLQAAEKFLHDAPSSVVEYLTVGGKPTLSSPHNLNLYLIPGNHDRYDGRFLLPGGKNFDNTFQSTSNANWPVGQSAYEIDVLKKEGVSLGIIGGDLSLRSSGHVRWGNAAQVWGAGRAYQDVVDEMVRLTEKMRNENSPIEVIWLVHFPPSFPNPAPCLPLLDEDILIKAMLNNDINFLLTGHTHDEEQYQITGVSASNGVKSVQVLCAGSATEHRLPSSHDQRTVHFLEFTVSAGNSSSVVKETLSWSDIVNYWVP